MSFRCAVEIVVVLGSPVLRTFNCAGKSFKERYLDVPVILTTGYATVDTAISALLHKACDPTVIHAKAQKATESPFPDTRIRAMYASRFF